MKSKAIFISLILLIILSCSDDRTTESQLPANPSNFTLTQVDAGSIYLSWQDNSINESGFRIDRKIGTGGWEIEHALPGEDATGWLDDELTVFAEYKYRICAFNQDELSAFVTASLHFIDLDSLAAPSNLILEQLNAGSIKLTWQDNSSAEEGFIIDRKIGEADWEENYQILAANTTGFTDEGLDEIATYYYRISAYSADATSGYVQSSIDFSFNDVVSIGFEQTGQIVITPYEPYQITVLLKDYTGEIVQKDYEVWFKLLACPSGTNINNLIYNIGDSLAVQSYNGIAGATLYGGMQSGSIAIEVYTYNILEQKISAIKSNIISYYSLPENISISHGGVDAGINVGGGYWQIEVIANITDSYGNPGLNGTAVWFSLEDPSQSYSDPVWANIVSEAYIGNENTAGYSYEGLAFTTLTFNGAYTNEELIIRAEVSGYAGIISESMLTTMPLQFGNILITPIPSQISWQNTSQPYTNGEDSLATTIHVVVTDGQNNPINGQEVIFICSYGSPQPSLPGTDPYLGWTGVVGGQSGILNKIFYFFKYECSPPIPMPPGVTQITITAKIAGINESDNCYIALFRYVD